MDDSSSSYVVPPAIGNNGPVPAPRGQMGLMPSPTGDERTIGKGWYLGDINTIQGDDYEGKGWYAGNVEDKLPRNENQGKSRIFTATGPVADINFEEDVLTVSEIKKAIQEQTGVPVSEQRIMHGGKTLDEATELSSAKALESCAAGSLAMVREVESTMYIMGGKSEDGALATLDRFRPVLDCWSPIPTLRPLGMKRSGLQAVALDGFIYAIGGRDGLTGRVLDELDRFDPVKNTWTSLEPMHNRREGHAVTVASGKIFVVGGSDGCQALNTAECFDPETNVWKTLPPLQIRREGLALAAVGNYLYAIGGLCGETALRVVEMLDLCHLEASWTLRAPELSVSRGYHAAAVVNDVIYVVGGRGGDNLVEDLCTAEMLGPGMPGWQPITSMGLRRSHHAAAAVDGEIYVLGGCRTGDYTSREVSRLHGFRAIDIYNPAKRSWRPGPEMSSVRYDFATAVI